MHQTFVHRDDGKRYTYDGISCMFRRYVKKCGLLQRVFAPNARIFALIAEWNGDLFQCRAEHAVDVRQVVRRRTRRYAMFLQLQGRIGDWVNPVCREHGYPHQRSLQPR